MKKEKEIKFSDGLIERMSMGEFKFIDTKSEEIVSKDKILQEKLKKKLKK